MEWSMSIKRRVSNQYPETYGNNFLFQIWGESRKRRNPGGDWKKERKKKKKRKEKSEMNRASAFLYTSQPTPKTNPPNSPPDLVKRMDIQHQEPAKWTTSKYIFPRPLQGSAWVYGSWRLFLFVPVPPATSWDAPPFCLNDWLYSEDLN
ncbi:hypothetical protein AWENTII_001293 [Aspergillus wentii]